MKNYYFLILFLAGLTTVHAQLNVTNVWTAKCGTGAIRSASPVLSPDNQTIYFGAAVEGKLYAINHDGTWKWTFDLGKDGAVGDQNNASASVGADGTVYMPNNGNNTKMGYLYAVNPDGTEKWKTEVGATKNDRVNYVTSAILADGNIMYGSRTNLYKINSMNGEILATVACGAYGNLVSSLDGLVYTVYGSNGVFCFDSNDIQEGKMAQKWQYKVNEGSYYLSCSQTVNSDGSVLGAGGTGRIYSINSDMTVNWLYPSDSETAKIEQSGVTISANGLSYYVSGADGSKIYALKADGTLKWEYATEGGAYCVPALDNLGYIHFIDNKGYYYILKDNDTSAEVLYKQLQTIDGIEPSGSAGWSSILIGGDGRVYFTLAYSDNNIYLFAKEVEGVTSYNMNSAWPMKNGNPQRTGLQKNNTPSSVFTSSVVDSFSIYKSGTSLMVKSAVAGMMEIYDVTGRKVAVSKIKAGEISVPFDKTGLFLIKMGSQIKKVIL